MPLPTSSAELSRVLLEDPHAQVAWSLSIAHSTADATTYYWLGAPLASGLMLVDMTVTSSTAMAKSATDYVKFQPVVSVPFGNTVSVEWKGTGRGTNAVALVANVPLRCHDERRLNYRVPKDALVGVLVTTVDGGTLAAHQLSFVARLKRV